MASIINVSLGINPDAILAMSASLGSLASVFQRSAAAAQPFAESLSLLVDTSNIFSFEDRVGPAPAAEIVSAFTIAPTDRYLCLCAALVADGYADTGAWLHGWPFLLPRGESAIATIAEGVAAANPVLNSRCRAPGGLGQ